MTAHHSQLINGVSEELEIFFKNSSQAIYAYLDDAHKVCNDKFASLLGYKTPEEWANITVNADSFVAEQSVKPLAAALQKTRGDMAASNINVTWKKKSGSFVNTGVVVVPFSYQGHIFSLYFVIDVAK